MKQRANAEVGHLAFRVALLAALLFAVNTWSIRHLGVNPGEITAINTFLGLFYVSLGLFAKNREERFNEAFRLAFARALTVPVLLTIALLVLVFTSFVSSVTILAAGHAGTTETRLTGEGRAPNESSRQTLKGPDGVVRYRRFISPFGSAFYLLTDGYQREPIQLRPWVGATITLAELAPLPSILLRIPHEHHGSLKGATLGIEIEGRKKHVIKLERGRASVLLGPDLIPPASNQQNWRSELRTLAQAPPALQEVLFRNWIEPVRDVSVPPLLPGQKITVSFTTSADKTVAQKRFTVGRYAFQDVLLTTKEE